jgi:hypothetical protein
MMREVKAVLLIFVGGLFGAVIGAGACFVLGDAGGCVDQKSHTFGDTLGDARGLFAPAGAMAGVPGGYLAGLVGSTVNTRAGWVAGWTLGAAVSSIPFAVNFGVAVSFMLAVAGVLIGLAIGRALPGGRMVGIRLGGRWLIDPTAMEGWPVRQRCAAAVPALGILIAIVTWAVLTW